jgi:hypothetical protein
MSSLGTRAWSILIVALCLSASMACRADAGRVHLSKKLTRDETGCLSELIAVSHEADVPSKERHQLAAVAKVGRAHLIGNGREDYFYLFEDMGWCGSGGCLLIPASGNSQMW